jgi:hypothetical protein
MVKEAVQTAIVAVCCFVMLRREIRAWESNESITLEILGISDPKWELEPRISRYQRNTNPQP